MLMIERKYLLGSDPTNELGDTTVTAEDEYSTNFSEQQRKCGLCLHTNGNNSFWFVNEVKIYQFKAKYSELNSYLF